MATKCITTNQMSEKVSSTMCLNTNIALICALMQINKFVSNCFLTTNGPELSTIIGYTEKKNEYNRNRRLKPHSSTTENTFKR